MPGGLVRANSATNGRGQPYDPYTVSFIDSVSTVKGNHFLKSGGEIRAIRMATDRLGGITYSFANLSAFLNNTASTVQYLGDVSAPSPFNNGATGPRHVAQEYYIAYAQDEWHVSPLATLNYGLRYEYYTPLRETNDLQVKFNIDTGVIDPNTTPALQDEEATTSCRGWRSPMRPERRCSRDPASGCSSGLARRKTRFSRSRATASARRSATRRSRSIRTR